MNQEQGNAVAVGGFLLTCAVMAGLMVWLARRADGYMARIAATPPVVQWVGPGPAPLSRLTHAPDPAARDGTIEE